MDTYLKFESSIEKLDAQLDKLRKQGAKAKDKSLRELQDKIDAALAKTYQKLTPWQKVQVARHPTRPHFMDYIYHLVEDFTPLAGDRNYADDLAIQGGLGRWLGRPVMVLGHEKGKDAESRVRHNFGMARPEGYRKAIRLMTLAEQFRLPLVSLVDTAGAYPGVGAEERGQSEAIARCTKMGLQLTVPSIAVIIGEGGSGGALALASANRVLMLEHSIYTVASPEACASILWRAADKAEDAAEHLKLTAQSLARLGVIDRILSEPPGGAHRNAEGMIATVGDAVIQDLDELGALDADALLAHRQNKYLAMGRGLNGVSV